MTAQVLNATGPWGAIPSEWDHLTFICGLTEDLLPVVSNPDAVISSSSKLASKGKVPSVYDRNGQVVGMAAWTHHQTTDGDIRRWRPISDYGICIQSRRIRALDVDVTDKDLAARINRRIADVLGIALPCRSRGNAAKFLLAFDMPGAFPKRIIKTQHGNIEFLGTGQQFVAIGTHPSRARYVWIGGLPDEFPTVEPEVFEALWSALADEFGGGQSMTMGASRRQGSGAKLAEEDLVGEYLEGNGWVLSEGRSGEKHIRCPFEDGHSMGEAGDGSTTYFPPDDKFQQGHFRCLHGSCTGRKDGDFLIAAGYQQDVFADLVAVDDGTAPPPLPSFARNKNGEILPSVDNTVKALRRPDMTGLEIGFDSFKDAIMLAEQPGEWREFDDSDYTELRIRLEARGFKPVGRELIRDAVWHVAKGNKFDSAVAWLDALVWDRVPRIERFMADYMGAKDSTYHAGVSRYLWTALAGRIIVPGVKADMVPILIGPQGARKSSAVAAIAPAPEFFCEISFHEKENDQSRKMRGRLVAELSELRGLNSKDEESIKAFVTRTHEDWTPKFKEFNTTFPRRLVIVGTTNQDEFLVDETGHRRWLPVTVGEINSDRIVAERLQLWAEAATVFRAEGVYWQAEKLAADEHKKHLVSDPWQEIVTHWLADPALDGSKPGDLSQIKAVDVLRGALHIDGKNISRREEMRIGKVLRTLGYSKTRHMAGGARSYVWVKNCESGDEGVPF